MFEANPPKAFHGNESGKAGELRPLTWSDLRARLEAARDLRAAMLADAEDAHASFDAHFARQLTDRANGKDAVYPDDLANGKGPSAMSAFDDSGTGSDPRK